MKIEQFEQIIQKSYIPEKQVLFFKRMICLISCFLGIMINFKMILQETGLKLLYYINFRSRKQDTTIINFGKIFNYQHIKPNSLLKILI